MQFGLLYEWPNPNLRDWKTLFEEGVEVRRLPDPRSNRIGTRVATVPMASSVRRDPGTSIAGMCCNALVTVRRLDALKLDAVRLKDIVVKRRNGTTAGDTVPRWAKDDRWRVRLA